MSASGKITISREGDVCVVRFNDPASRNALGMDMAAEIRDALLAAEADCGAVLLAGGDKAFCSGANLGGPRMGDGAIDAGLILQDTVNPLMMTIRDLAIPIVTSVRGAAAGVGASLALAGDIIVASEDAFFLQAFCRIGLVPDGGSPWLLMRTAGRARAMEMMLLGDRLPAAKALEWGMINRVVPSAEADATALQIAQQLADGPRLALGLIRKAGWYAADHGFGDELALERNLQRTVGKSADFAEGVAAFLEKRPARFNQG
ncbi:enoyl-CoA hydratase-related protein [Novosphingobium sp. KCTC 2891]|uniref:enoyl-CoA hydratase-related protein n=1 Tax=Novosphingobium sp. KCTC 2891 TaxID=2989730 RepID=UPI002223E315|nr:enoyl-CoA hydratase-related protein [Novosphingobium sp. KCTC 2891]MCW1383164.1 enoyl-CoA hydratase-related protein [Novosphingobium sp. KCTC 2891]